LAAGGGHVFCATGPVSSLNVGRGTHRLVWRISTPLEVSELDYRWPPSFPLNPKPSGSAKRRSASRPEVRPFT